MQWKRQAEADAVLAGVPAALTAGGVLEVAGLAHLERILEEATGQLVVLTVYSRCGVRLFTGVRRAGCSRGARRSRMGQLVGFH